MACRVRTKRLAALRYRCVSYLDDSTTIRAEADTTTVDKISGMSTTVEVTTSTSYPRDESTTGSVSSEQDDDQSSELSTTP